MAKLQIGAAVPLNISDSYLSPYYQRVQGGEDATAVAKDFFNNAAQTVKGAWNDSGYYNEDILRPLGYDGSTNSLNWASWVLMGLNNNIGVDALKAVLSNQAQPTQYDPVTKKVVSGTVVPTQSSSSSSSSGSTESAPYRAIVLGDGREVNYDYADPAVRAMADSGKYKIKQYGNPSSSASNMTTTQAPALGTPEYTNYLIEQGKSLGLNLEQYRVPTTASSGSGAGALSFPAQNPTMGSIGDAVAGTNGLSEYLQQQLKSIDQQRQDILSQQNADRSWLEEFLSSSKDATEIRAEAEAAAGVNSQQFFADQQAKIAEINTLTEQYNALAAAKDAQIAQSYDKMASTNFINNQIAQINRNAAPELNRLSSNINAKAATLQALQGNFDRAQTYINQAVDDATAAKREKLETFSLFYQMNQDTLTRLDTQYQNAFNTAFEIAKLDYQNDLLLKQSLADLQLKNPQVAINLNGTLDAAVAAIRSNPAAQKGDIFGSAESGYFERYFDPASGQYKTRSLTGGTGGGTTASGDTYGYLLPVMQAAIDAGGDSNIAALKAIEYAESKGIQLSAKERAGVTSLAQSLKTSTSAPGAQGTKPVVVKNALGQVVYDQSRDQSQRSSGGLISGPVKSFFSNLFGD